MCSFLFCSRSHRNRRCSSFHLNGLIDAHVTRPHFDRWTSSLLRCIRTFERLKSLHGDNACAGSVESCNGISFSMKNMLMAEYSLVVAFGWMNGSRTALSPMPIPRMNMKHKLRRINRMERIIFARKNLIKIHIFIIGCPVMALTTQPQVSCSEHFYVPISNTHRPDLHPTLTRIWQLHSYEDDPHAVGIQIDTYASCPQRNRALCIRSHPNEYEKRDHVLCIAW